LTHERLRRSKWPLSIKRGTYDFVRTTVGEMQARERHFTTALVQCQFKIKYKAPLEN